MDPMSIASASSSMAAGKTLSAVGMKVMGMALDSANQQAAGEVAMLDSMPSPSAISAMTGVGGNFDATA